MREIRFRLRLDNEIVGYEKWYPGELAEVTPDEPGDLYWRAHPCWLYSLDGTTWRPAPILHNRKDAFVNLPDKNGVEIYEGDIVVVDFCDIPDDNPLHHTGAVEWDVTNAAWSISDYDFMFNYYEALEVVGNICENPELIDGQD